MGPSTLDTNQPNPRYLSPLILFTENSLYGVAAKHACPSTFGLLPALLRLILSPSLLLAETHNRHMQKEIFTLEEQ